MQKSVILIVAVLVAGLLIGSSFTGQAVRKRPIGDGHDPTGPVCVTRLTTSGNNFNPNIDGNTVVWFDHSPEGYGLYKYDIFSGVKTRLALYSNLVNPFVELSSLEIKNNKVAYAISDPTYRSKIYLHDLTNGNSGFLPNVYNGALLSIDNPVPYFDIYEDKVVFNAAYANNLSGDGIYLYNLRDNTLRLVVNTDSPGTPSIYGNNVSFDYGSAGSSDYLHIADISSLPSHKFLAVYYAGNERAASDAMLYKTYIVFANVSKYNYNNHNIILKKENKIQKIIKVGKLLYYNKPPAKIWGNWISWAEYDPTNTKSDVFIYDIQNNVKKQITYGLTGSSPDTSNNKLVYLSSQGYSDNSKNDIYLYNLAIC